MEPHEQHSDSTASPEALLIVDLDARIVRANEAACRALGYTAAALTRMGLADLDARLESASWSRRLAELRLHGAVTSEARLCTCEGASLDVTLSAVYVALGAEARVCVTLRAHPRPSSFEAEAIAARNQLAATLDAIPDLLFEVDLDGRYYACHAPRAALLAAPPDELIGRTIADVLPPAAAEVCMGALREAHERGHSFGAQFELPLEQGRAWFELSVSRKAVAPGDAPRFIVLSRDVTERKRAEEALRESEVQLRSILGSTVDGILAVDRAGRVVRTNRRFAELWRIPASIIERGDDEAMLKFVVDQLADPKAFLHKVESLYQSDEELTDTVRFIDGRLFERFTAPLLLNGANVGRVWSFRDVTARDQAESALRASRNLLQSIIDTAPMRVFWKDRELRYLGCNPAFAADAGRASPSDVIGLDDFDMPWSDDAELQRVVDRAVISFGAPRLSYDETQRTAEGGERWLRKSMVPLRGHDGATLGVLGIYEDITERRRVEQRLGMAVEVTQVLLWELDLITGHLTYDRSMFETLGLGDMVFSDNLAGWFEAVHPDDLPAVRGALDLSLSPGHPVFDCEYRVRDPRGGIQWIHSRGRVVRHDSSGAPSAAVGSSMNITARKETEVAQVAARVAAEAANRAKSEFLANMSHEIRTPLNGVLGNIQLLEMTALDAEQKEYLSAITASGRNLLSLINDILDLSKIEADKLVLDASPFSLRACVEGAVSMQRAPARERGLTLTAVVPGEVPEALLGDELRVRQILLNLVGNAVKFTHAGGVTVSVAVRERVGDAAMIELRVADTGIGISPALAAEVFKPFVQADSSITRRYGGTGLGLAICARLTERMGGSIAVESVEGAGSTFRVTLPLTVVPTAAASAGPQPQPVEALWTDAPRRILLVEDNPVSRRFGVVLLTKMRHEVTAVEHGREALDALARARFDVVLMDIQMPVMDGTAAIAELRERERGTAEHTPVIAVTACASKDEERALLDAGFDGYVRKPLGVRELVEQMRHALRGPRGGAVTSTPRRG